jgi:hypothetical protein
MYLNMMATSHTDPEALQAMYCESCAMLQWRWGHCQQEMSPHSSSHCLNRQHLLHAALSIYLRNVSSNADPAIKLPVVPRKLILVRNPPKTKIIWRSGLSAGCDSMIMYASHHSCWSNAMTGVTPCRRAWSDMYSSVDRTQVGSVGVRLIFGCGMW